MHAVPRGGAGPVSVVDVRVVLQEVRCVPVMHEVAHLGKWRFAAIILPPMLAWCRVLVLCVVLAIRAQNQAVCVTVYTDSVGRGFLVDYRCLVNVLLLLFVLVCLLMKLTLRNQFSMCPTESSPRDDAFHTIAMDCFICICYDVIN